MSIHDKFIKDKSDIDRKIDLYNRLYWWNLTGKWPIKEQKSKKPILDDKSNKKPCEDASSKDLKDKAT